MKQTKKIHQHKVPVTTQYIFYQSHTDIYTHTRNRTIDAYW